MKFSWKPILLACLGLVAALPTMAESRGGDRQRERIADLDRRGEISERRRAEAERARDRRRHLSEDERARLRRDVLEAFRAGREGR